MALSEKMISAISDVFEAFGEQITTEAKSALEAMKINASNNLSDSFQFKVSSTEAVVTLEIFADSYLQYIENGRQPGKMPPVQSIIKWIEYKGVESFEKPGIRRGIIDAKGVRASPGMRRGQPAIIRRNVKVSNEKMAFAIAKSIMKRGQQGKQFYKPIIENIADEMSKKLTDAVLKSIEEDYRDVWQEGSNTDFLTYKISF